MEKYIITMEDGTHYVSEQITNDDINALHDGIISIVRCSDQKELGIDGIWHDLEDWQQYN